ncbi:MAG: acyl-protein synthetase [Pseudomonadota bacterium]|nr:acyl-protein synthetase [Pseudomonadota bacterium]
MTDIFDYDPYVVSNTEKQAMLTRALAHLHATHSHYCPTYHNIIRTMFPEPFTAKHDLLALPYVHVKMFKHAHLKTVQNEQIIKTLTSSGTSGDVSHIYLDAETASLQSKVLVKVMQHWIGKARLPMLILDHAGVVSNRRQFSARGAGIRGLAFMGRKHCYALKEDMSLDLDALREFCQQFGDQPVLIFGFTFMVWQYVLAELHKHDISFSLPHGILLHSGGWKKLQDQAVSNTTFKQIAAKTLGVTHVHNFYGMVEQVGAIYVECEHGHLHCPTYSDIRVRRTIDWQPAAIGEEGVIQLISALPRSYPGHSILTEDRGVVLGTDDCPCGRLGTYFKVCGRLQQAETRGCSDTFVKKESA